MFTNVVRTGVALGLAAVTGCGVAAAPSAHAAASTLSGCRHTTHYEVCFTDPNGPGGGKAIEKRLGELVDSTKSDKGKDKKRVDKIRVAMYVWDRKPLARKLAAAADRGVKVKVVLDARVQKHPKKFHHIYRFFKKHKVSVTSCTGKRGGCLGNGINHNKLFLFKINGVRSVALSSFNITNNQLKHYNNMTRIIGAKKLYAYYLGYWQRLHRQDWGRWNTDKKRTKHASLGTAYLFPRKKDDPILSILNNVTQCKGEHDKVYLAESTFDDGRPALRRRLGYLQSKLHCDVRVVVAQPEDEKWVQAKVGAGHNLTNAKVRNAKVHHKFVAIDAQYNGKWRRVVETGSHNLGSGSLRRTDESIVVVRSGFVFKQYSKHFGGVYELAQNS